MNICPRLKRLSLILWLRIRHGDQWWFWTPEWQAGERAADADIAAGRGTTHMSSQEFLESFDD